MRIFTYFIFIISTTFCFALKATEVTFVNNSDGPLSIWPVPTTVPAAMAAMVPPHSLPVQFSMSREFSQMYVLTPDSIGYLKSIGIDTGKPADVIKALPRLQQAVDQYPHLGNARIAKLDVNKVWAAFRGPKGRVLYAERIIAY